MKYIKEYKDIDWDDWDEEEIEPFDDKFICFFSGVKSYIGFLRPNGMVYIFGHGSYSSYVIGNLILLNNQPKIQISYHYTKPLTEVMKMIGINNIIKVGIDIHMTELLSNKKDYIMTEDYVRITYPNFF